MAPRVTATTCEICGRDAFIGKCGDVVCTPKCTSLRNYHRTREAMQRSTLRDVAAELRCRGFEARLAIDRFGMHVRADTPVGTIRLDGREDLTFLMCDLGERAA